MTNKLNTERVKKRMTVKTKKLCLYIKQKSIAEWSGYHPHLHPHDDGYLIPLLSPGLLEQHPRHPEGRRRQHRLHL